MLRHTKQWVLRGERVYYIFLTTQPTLPARFSIDYLLKSSKQKDLTGHFIVFDTSHFRGCYLHGLILAPLGGIEPPLYLLNRQLRAPSSPQRNKYCSKLLVLLILPFGKSIQRIKLLYPFISSHSITAIRPQSIE